MKKYTRTVTGGTFDLLHKGHKEFLISILEQSERVVIGLTSNAYIQKNKPDKGIFSYEIRKKELLDFFESIHVKDRVEVISIDNMYGPLLSSDFEADAIAVADSTKHSVEEINKKREESGLSRLELVEVPLERAEDGGLISATRIRGGEIDREGKLFFKVEWKNKILLLPPTLREKLQDVWGEMVLEIPKDIDIKKTITVGDITTKKFINLGFLPFLAIIDNMVERKHIEETKFENVKTIMVSNSPGTVSFALFDAIEKSFQEKESTAIIVDGEEDLSVLPALLCAPLGFTVFYGQPHVGMVKINVTEEIKDKARALLQRFVLQA